MNLRFVFYIQLAGLIFIILGRLVPAFNVVGFTLCGIVLGILVLGTLAYAIWGKREQ